MTEKRLSNYLFLHMYKDLLDTCNIIEILWEKILVLLKNKIDCNQMQPQSLYFLERFPGMELTGPP